MGSKQTHMWCFEIERNLPDLQTPNKTTQTRRLQTSHTGKNIKQHYLNKCGRGQRRNVHLGEFQLDPNAENQFQLHGISAGGR